MPAMCCHATTASGTAGIGFDGLDRAIDARISRLRKKLNRPGQPTRIKTVRGKGYLVQQT